MWERYEWELSNRVLETPLPELPEWLLQIVVEQGNACKEARKLLDKDHSER
jgi:hypothetical protein